MIPAFEHLSAETILSYLGVFFGTAIGALLWYRSNYKKPPIDTRKVAEDLVLTSGVIGDMGPVRQAAHSLEKIEGLLERWLEESLRCQREEIEEARRKREVWERIAHRLDTNAEVDRATRRRDGLG